MTLWTLPLLPLAGAAAAVLVRRHPRAAAGIVLGTTAATVVLAAWAASELRTAVWSWGPVLQLQLATDGFSRVMVVLVPAVALPILAYAAATEAHGRTRLLSLLVAFVAAMELLVVAADMLTLLIGWELVGAASWALIGFGWRDADSPRAALQAFVATRFGDLGLYAAAGAAFAATGSFAFADLSAAGEPHVHVIAGGLLLAAAAKSAQLPFSPWLFAAMAGPTPVSALLHSATLVAAGAYLLVRLAPTLGAAGWFLPAVAGVGLATALVGGVVATVQTHVKRVLAASTSAQYGLMFVAVGAGSVAAAGAHLVTHALFKSLLFLGAGVAIHAAGGADLAEMRLGRALRAAGAMSGVGAAALAAVPPLGAAWSKEAILAAAVHAGPWLAGGVLASAFLSAAYAARYHLLAYGRGAGGRGVHHRPGRAELLALVALASGTLALSLLWSPGAGRVVEAVTGGELAASRPWELPAGVALLAAALGGVWLLERRGALVQLGLPRRLQPVLADWAGVPTAARITIVAPLLALSAALARFDQRVVDGGVRAVAAGVRLASRLVWLGVERAVDAVVWGLVAAARGLSRLAQRRGERAFDGAVHAVAAGTMRAAAGSRVADDQGIDLAVEQLAAGVGVAGERSRDLQTGLTHHYYVIIAVGLVAGALVLALVR